MTHFGFLCPPFLGHLNPMQALAGELSGRGHATTFFGMADLGTSLREPGCAFVPLGTGTHPAGRLDALTAHMADPRGLKLFRVMRDMAAITDMLCREAPAAMKRAGVEAIVGDQLEPAAGLVAEYLGLPLVSVANALMIDREPGVPPPFVDWPYDPSPAGLRKNGGGYRVADLMMRAPARVVSGWARRWHLQPRSRIDQCVSRLAQVSQTVPGFDFPRMALPPTMHQCGPLRSPGEAVSVEDLLGDGRPLVYASLGTLQGGRLDVFRCIATACAVHDLRVVIAHGGRLAADDLARLPGRPCVRAFVPQRHLMNHAALAITNGGLNTVLDALAAGVPTIVIPIAFEQGAIGARLERCGAGLAVPLRKLTPARLGDAIARVRGDPGFATAAHRLAAEIRRAGGVARAADVIEDAAGARRLKARQAVAS